MVGQALAALNTDNLPTADVLQMPPALTVCDYMYFMYLVVQGSELRVPRGRKGLATVQQ